METLKMRCAIVDDDVKASAALKEHLLKYGEEYGIHMVISMFDDSAKFIFEYERIYDIIFLDVQMPKYNGMQTAEEIRKIDKEVFIIFETRFGQYALQGYQYDAMDYFIKPVTYQSVKMRLTMIKKYLSARPGIISFMTENNILKILSINDILYVEEVGRNQVYHTADGIEFINVKREGLASLEERLSKNDFARCNSGFLLNLRRCTEIKNNYAYIGEMGFEISRTFRKSFLAKLNQVIEG